jgi:hypothetical protein
VVLGTVNTKSITPLTIDKVVGVKLADVPVTIPRLSPAKFEADVEPGLVNVLVVVLAVMLPVSSTALPPFPGVKVKSPNAGIALAYGLPNMTPIAKAAKNNFFMSTPFHLMSLQKVLASHSIITA